MTASREGGVPSGLSTVTFVLRPEEMAVLEQMAAEHDMTIEAVLRRSLRLHQLIDRRLAAGETMHFSGDEARIAAFRGPIEPGR